ncbi:unnamed protein product [Phytomonas sp. EM1]|nr:unnamed protein product [Phytomonas sp. EM1]|eukprot:CCW61860.1 unnamed protein product [Phytomonas sp. isolate EM1]
MFFFLGLVDVLVAYFEYIYIILGMISYLNFYISEDVFLILFFKFQIIPLNIFVHHNPYYIALPFLHLFPCILTFAYFFSLPFYCYLIYINLHTSR